MSLSAKQQESADIILANTQIWTAENSALSDALAIKDSRIIYVGSTENVKMHRGPNTQWIELPERLVVPGFNDSHIHLMGGALSLERVDLIKNHRARGFLH